MKTAERKIIRLGAGLAVAAFVALLAGKASAAPQPRVESLITGAAVTLADVFEGVTQNADYVLAPAPPPGQPLVLNVADLERVSKAFGLGWRADHPLQQVVIKRQATVVSRSEIQETLQAAISAQLASQDVDVQLSGRMQDVLLEGNVEADVIVRQLDLDRARTTFTAQLALEADDKTQKTMTVAGRYHPIVQVPVLAKSMRSGDIISAGDIAYIRLRQDAVTPVMILDEQKMVGMTPRRGITADRPVTPSDLVPPRVVSKGDLVTVMLQNGPIALTVQGRALDAGAQGETVRVMNTASNTVMQAVVTGPQVVAVRTATGAL